MGGATLSATATTDNGTDSLKNDCQIKDEGHVFQIEHVVLELGHGVFNSGAVGVLHLRPAGQPGSDRVALVIVGNMLTELLHEAGPLRARSYKAHVSANDIDELRELV